MKPNLSVTIVGTIEGALQRTIIYSDGTRITLYWSRSLNKWVTIPND